MSTQQWCIGSVFTQGYSKYVLTYIAAPSLEFPKCYAQISTCFQLLPEDRTDAWKEELLGDTQRFYFCVVPPDSTNIPKIWVPLSREYERFAKANAQERDAIDKQETHFNLIVGKDKSSARMIDFPVFARRKKESAYNRLFFPTGMKCKAKLQDFLNSRNVEQEPILELFHPPDSVRTYRDIEIQWKTWAAAVLFNFELASAGCENEPYSSGCMVSDSRIVVMDADEEMPLASVQGSKEYTLLSVVFPKPRREELPLVIIKWSPTEGKSWVHGVITSEDYKNNAVMRTEANGDDLSQVLFGSLAGNLTQLVFWEEKVLNRFWTRPYAGTIVTSKLVDAPMDLREYFKVKRTLPDAFENFEELINLRLRMYTLCISQRFDRRLVNCVDEYKFFRLKTKEEKKIDDLSFLAMAAMIHFQTEPKSRIRYKWQYLGKRSCLNS